MAVGSCLLVGVGVAGGGPHGCAVPCASLVAPRGHPTVVGGATRVPVAATGVRLVSAGVPVAPVRGPVNATRARAKITRRPVAFTGRRLVPAGRAVVAAGASPMATRARVIATRLPVKVARAPTAVAHAPAAITHVWWRSLRGPPFPARRREAAWLPGLPAYASQCAYNAPNILPIAAAAGSMLDLGYDDAMTSSISTDEKPSSPPTRRMYIFSVT